MEKTVSVTLTHPFEMSKFEITQKQWQALGFPLQHRAPVCDDCPITFLNTHEAMAWCNALSRSEGLEECYDLSSCTGDLGAGCPDGDFYELGCLYIQNSDPASAIDGLYTCSSPVRRYDSMYDCTGYRLPTGPEWEYAAKAGNMTNTYNGDITVGSTSCIEEPILNDIAWYCFNTGAGDTDVHPDKLREVGLKQPNPWGLYDMLGNAGEWTDYVGTGFSLEDNEGKVGPLVDPMGAAESQGGRGDVRGGWFYTYPCTTRAASQFDDSKDTRGSAFGFRPVRTLPASAMDGGVK